MSGDKNVTHDREEWVIERALKLLESGGTGSASPRDGEHPSGEPLSEQEDRLLREYTEILGLLPYELEPVEPSPAVRRGVLSQLEPAPARATVSVIDPRRTGSGGAGRWLLPLAAVLALVMVGLTGALFLRVQAQSETIDRLAMQLGRTAERVERVPGPEAVAARERRLAVATAPGVEICPLSPVGERPHDPDARGVLYVADGPQPAWYLVLHDLDAAPAGRHYRVWFMVDGEPVGGPAFRARGEGRTEVESARLPGAMHGVLVTLESEEAAPRPRGERVLYGDEVMQVLTG